MDEINQMEQELNNAAEESSEEKENQPPKEPVKRGKTPMFPTYEANICKQLGVNFSREFTEDPSEKVPADTFQILPDTLTSDEHSKWVSPNPDQALSIYWLYLSNEFKTALPFAPFRSIRISK